MESYPCIMAALLLAAALLQFGMPGLEGRPRAALRLTQVACVSAAAWLLAVFCLEQDLAVWIQILAGAALVYLVFFAVLFIPGLLARRSPEASDRLARGLTSIGSMLAVFSFFTKLPSVEDEDVSEDQIRELLAEADEEDIDEPQK
ncbi:hypothetical protein, partial [Faecalibaculum rodentium]